MSLHDNRTKPDTQWTYYVVDHRPTMGNIYRYDTPEEAIQCYRALPPDLQSAIGSSIGGVHELDLIHRRSNNTPVFLKDASRIEPGLWRESQEAQAALDFMLSELHVEHELNSQIFGGHLPSVIVDLDRHQDDTIDNYFQNSILFPDKPREYRSAIVEVFSQGHGWVKTDAFLGMLKNSVSRDQTGNIPDYYVNRLSVRYLDLKTGYSVQADLSPREYTLLREKTEQLLSPSRLACDLYALFSEHIPDAPALQKGPRTAVISAFEEQIAAGRLRGFQKDVSQILTTKGIDEDTRQQAFNLYGRIMALTPREFLRDALSQRIAQAEKESSRQQKPMPETHDREGR